MSRPDGYLLGAKLAPEAIVAEVARGFGLSYDDVTGPCRARHLIRARVIAMAVVRRATDLSYPQIGRLFGRHHTTVVHHVAKVTADAELARAAEAVLAELSPHPQLFEAGALYTQLTRSEA